MTKIIRGGERVPRPGGGSYWEPGVILCDDCEKEVVLCDPMTNECNCGELYNGGGQHLAPRSQWDTDVTDNNYP